MSVVAEFKAIVGKQNRITIPPRINVEWGEEVLITVKKIDEEAEITD